MNEDFLHFVWKFKYFRGNLICESGENVRITNTGIHNHDAGSDFHDSRLYIGDTLWAGNVEIHVKASDWYAHHHHEDAAYDNVILHVVYENDKPVYRRNGEAMPTLVLKDRFPEDLYNRYLEIVQHQSFVACEKQIGNILPAKRIHFLERMAIERLEEKVERILAINKHYNNSWEDTFYESLLTAFGLPCNQTAFSYLAKSLPLNYLNKHKSNLFQLEALLFGQSGLLNKDFEDMYLKLLKQEYLFLQQKFKLQPIDPKLWKFLRMRPSSFPTIRLAQFAKLLFASSHLFAKIQNCETTDRLYSLLQCDVSEYWQSHYVFDKPSKWNPKTLGINSQQGIVVNVIAPLLFAYGKTTGKENLCQQALNYLYALEAEENHVIKSWRQIGIRPCNALESQALIHVKNNYCDLKKCLGCEVGVEVLKGG